MLQQFRVLWKAFGALPQRRCFASKAEEILNSLTNYEQIGVPSHESLSQGKAFDLGCMHNILESMGSPHNKLKVVHVAGTKGKGSVSTMLSHILQQSGYTVGTYTSPHVTSIRERIACNQEPISSSAFDDLAVRHTHILDAANQRQQSRPSHFEFLTALALKHFEEQQVDIAVIETGLGGTYDATNVFAPEQLQLAIITTLGLEHQAALGDTIEEIAQAKAGICKPGRPLIVGSQDHAGALDALKSAAAAINASPILEAGSVTRIEPGEICTSEESARQNVRIMTSDTNSLEVKSRLIGEHQAKNAESAVAAALKLQEQGWSNITWDSIKSGLECAIMPGRFQIKRLGADKPWLVLDGAHTPPAGQALAETLQATFPDQPVALIIAMAIDKDHAGMMRALRKIKPAVVVFTSINIAGAADRSAPPGMLAGQWQAANLEDDMPLRCRELLQANMATALESCERELFAQKAAGVICVTGSLHAVGAMLDLQLTS